MRPSTIGFRGDGLAILAYVPLTVGFFWQLAFLPNTWVPKGGGDLVSFLYPVYSFAAAQVRHGSLPLWNPYLYGGSPFAADMQSGLFYPLHLLAFFLFPFSYAMLEWLAVVHYFLAGIFAYLYLRGLALKPVAAFGGGLVFAFGGFNVAHLGHLNMLEAAVWLPLILYWLHRGLARRSLPAAALAGLVYGVSILAGHTQVTLYFALFLTIYWLGGLLILRQFSETRNDQTQQAAGTQQAAPLRDGRRGTALLVLPVAGIVAFGIAAVQLLPSYELTRLSIRSDLTYAQASEYAASPLGLVTLFVAGFFGGDNLAYWGVKGSLAEVYGYVGLLPLLLAAVALFVVRRGSAWRWFYCGAAIFFLLLSLGQSTVLHGWLYKFVPGFDKVRAAGRFLVLFDFAVAVLAAYGLNFLAERPGWRERPRYRLLLVFSGLATVLSLPVAAFFYRTLLASQDKDPTIYQRIASATNGVAFAVLMLALGVALLAAHRYGRRSGLIPYLAIAVIAVDLFSTGAGFNPTTEDVTKPFEHPQVIAFLHKDPGPFRIDSVTGVWEVWPPDLSLREGIGDVMGIFNPMLLADYDRYWQSLGSRSVPAYDLLNAKYVVAKKDVVLDWNKFVPVLTDAPKVNVYENKRVLPRAFLVPAAEVVSREQQLDRLKSPDFDPQRLLLIDTPADLPPEADQTPLNGRVSGIDISAPNRVGVQTEANRAAYLFFGDVWYPGWQVTIDGRPAPIVRADYLFRAVVVPAGEHQVQFAFRPLLWVIGAGLSGLTVLGLVVMGVTWLWKRRVARRAMAVRRAVV